MKYANEMLNRNVQLHETDGILRVRGIVYEPIDEVWNHEHKGITHKRDRRGS